MKHVKITQRRVRRIGSRNKMNQTEHDPVSWKDFVESGKLVEEQVQVLEATGYLNTVIGAETSAQGKVITEYELVDPPTETGDTVETDCTTLGPGDESEPDEPDTYDDPIVDA